ncbi:hypothetical protein AGMMS49940_13530 [Spirochaetia bacterium]|nr:hypothetical protein AGMMS49940_13530 [Spirochaetia bacterium]
MTTKLTLTMDNTVIERAKEYARKKNSSVSGIVETYLDTISGSAGSAVHEAEPEVLHAPITDSLMGMFHDDGRDYKEVINEAKMERFTKKSI